MLMLPLQKVDCERYQFHDYACEHIYFSNFCNRHLVWHEHHVPETSGTYSNGVFFEVQWCKRPLVRYGIK